MRLFMQFKHAKRQFLKIISKVGRNENLKKKSDKKSGFLGKKPTKMPKF